MFSKKSFSVVFLKKNLHLGAANLKQQKLSNSEKYAWQFIQDHLESIPALSIVALGQQANVSTATIIRGPFANAASRATVILNTI